MTTVLTPDEILSDEYHIKQKVLKAAGQPFDPKGLYRCLTFGHYISCDNWNDCEQQRYIQCINTIPE